MNYNKTTDRADLSVFVLILLISFQILQLRESIEDKSKKLDLFMERLENCCASLEIWSERSDCIDSNAQQDASHQSSHCRSEHLHDSNTSEMSRDKIVREETSAHACANLGAETNIFVRGGKDFGVIPALSSCIDNSESSFTGENESERIRNESQCCTDEVEVSCDFQADFRKCSIRKRQRLEDESQSEGDIDEGEIVHPRQTSINVDATSSSENSGSPAQSANSRKRVCAKVEDADQTRFGRCKLQAICSDPLEPAVDRSAADSGGVTGPSGTSDCAAEPCPRGSKELMGPGGIGLELGGGGGRGVFVTAVTAGGSVERSGAAVVPGMRVVSVDGRCRRLGRASARACPCV